MPQFICGLACGFLLGAAITLLGLVKSAVKRVLIIFIAVIIPTIAFIFMLRSKSAGNFVTVFSPGILLGSFITTISNFTRGKRVSK